MVGKNGSGKSTLLKILSGNLNQEEGSVKLNGETIGYLRQEIDHKFDDYTIIEYLKIETGIYTLEKELENLQNNLTDENIDTYSDVLNEYMLLDGYSFDDNLKKYLNGLKLNKTPEEKIKTLSGGEKIKVLLALLLLENKDILLLDEPTNNLDIEAITWLEKKLSSFNRTIILVSHDEIFLEQIANKVFYLENGIINECNMKYSLFLEEREKEYQRDKEKYENAKEEKERLKKELEKAKKWVNSGMSKKAFNDNDKIANNYARERTNTSNVSKLSKALDNLNIPDFKEKKPIDFFLLLDDNDKNKDIIFEDLIVGYNNFKTLPISMQIEYGTKIKISGNNGSGKTTLIKTLLGDLNPISGKIIKGNGVKIGYISQDTFANEDKSIIEYLTEGTRCEPSHIFILLSKFGIDYDEKDKKYSTLSPGERTRVNLVKLALQKINTLVLDEVTNHLDRDALNLIYDLIQNFPGTIISISHNRKYNDLLNADYNLDIETGKLKILKKSL